MSRGTFVLWVATLLAGVCSPWGGRALAQSRPEPWGFRPPREADSAYYRRQLLTADEPRDRAETARALGSLGDRRAVRALTEAATSDPSDRVRAAASRAL